MPKPNEPSPGDVAAPAGQTNAIKIQHIMRFSIDLYIYRILCAIYRFKYDIQDNNTYINKWCSTV